MFRGFATAMVVAVCCTVFAAAAAAPAARAEVQLARTSFVVPEQKIEGAEQPVLLGELADLSVTPIKHPPEHLASTGYHWRVYDGTIRKRVRESPDGTSIFFAAGLKPKRLTVQLVVTHLYVVKDDGKVTEVATRTVILDTTLTIGEPEPGPGPGPGPTPPPGPEPAFPDGQFKLAGLSYGWARARVTDAPARTKGAPALAASFRSLASSFSAGATKDLTSALKQSKDANNLALTNAGVSPDRWDDFGVSLQDTVYELYKTNKIKTVADLATAWREVAAGLEQVK